MDVGKAIIRRRVRRGLSQSALARRSGVPRQVLARIEAGSTPSVTTIERVAAALDVPVWRLIKAATNGGGNDDAISGG